MRELNKNDDMRFDQYIARKLRAWYTKFPSKQPIRGLGGGGSDDDGEGQVETGRGIRMNSMRP